MSSSRPVSAAEAEATYAKAVDAESANDFNLAFRLYINAAEAFLHLSRSLPAHTDQQRSKFRADAQKSLQRAEKIKAFADKNKSVTLTPVDADPFSDKQQLIVLQKGSRVGDLLIPPWDQPPLNTNVTTQPKLSPAHIAANAEWKRPISQGKYINLLPHEIRQHVITDCSVSASISVLLEHARRFNTQGALSACLTASRFPEIYYLRLLFNGIWRRVEFNDTLPYQPTTGDLLCMSTSVPGVIWPGLVEKGYMKLMGGYDFPGSDTSTDIHVLAGWIPEHMPIRSSAFRREEAWARCSQGFANGHCVLTVGTPPQAPLLDYQLLLPSHSYAVADVIEDEDERYLVILQSFHLGAAGTALGEPTTAKITWSQVLETFESIYLSWTPAILPRTLVYHGLWQPGIDGDTVRQHRISLDFETDHTMKLTDAYVWILLTRHVTNLGRTNEYIALDVQVQDEIARSSQNVELPDVSVKGTYTSAMHTLYRSQIPSGLSRGKFSICAMYDSKYDEAGFTIVAYTAETVRISWDQAGSKRKLLFTSKVDGAFTNKTAGGNSTFPTFMCNPQYKLHVHPGSSSQSSAKASIVLFMQAGRGLALNVTITWSNGDRIFELSEKEIVGSSGSYGYGLARVIMNIRPGVYTVILSAFEPQQMGAFTLRAESSHRVELTAIPQEGSGTYNHIVRGEWNKATAAGGPSWGRFVQNPIYEIRLPSAGQLRVRLQLLKTSPTTYINVCIYPSSPTANPLGKLLGTSGTYDNANSGVVTPQISLAAGTYWIIPSTFNPDVIAEFRLVVYCTTSGVTIARKD